MIDIVAAQMAIRSRVLSAVAATTGVISLGATGRTFTRASGSFLTDGFRVGMEVQGTGFSSGNNAPSIVTHASALALTVNRDLGTQGAAGSRSLTVGIPIERAWDGVTLQPTAGRWQWKEDFVPGNRDRYTLGHERETGLYVGRLYAVAGYGFEAIRRVTTAILDRVPPSDRLDAGSDLLEVRGDPAPYAGQIRALDTGHVVVTITIPWRAHTAAPALT